VRRFAPHRPPDPRGGTVALLAAAAGILVAALVPRDARAGAVHRVEIEGPINPIRAEYAARAIERAERDGSGLVLLVIDTPGGLGDSMEQIIRRMLASRVPIAAYVHPPGAKAASAGFFILMSADVAAMAPGTRAGAASPVLAIGGIIPIGEESAPPREGEGEGGGEAGGETGEGARKPARRSGDSTIVEKIRQDARAFLRAVAERRGRNVATAELAITESKSFTDREALDGGLIDIIAASESELLEKLDGREVRMLDGTTRVLATKGASIAAVERTFREKALGVLTDPNLVFVMLLLGALLVYVEINHPGLIVPGVVGGIFLLLALTGFAMLPVGVAGVLLLLAAVGLFIAEFKVQSYGLLGLAGVVCLALGGIMLVDLPEEGIRVDPYLAVSAAVALGGILLFLVWLSAGTLKLKATTGAEGLAGLEGEALGDLAPRGKVFLRGEYWDAVASSAVPKGARVRCVGAAGLVLHVEVVEAGGGVVAGGSACAEGGRSA
ncbi:MAG: nodulation protein NfeD, partial [Myxococcota bacterium]|nr:nodulation protein NfeD [Myxococcota bacterium]